MRKKSFVKLSEAELHEKVARYEKAESVLKRAGIYSMVIGVAGVLLSLAVEIGFIMFISCVIFAVGCICLCLKRSLRNKEESLVMDQLDDFYEEELAKAFGPRQHNKEMGINKPLIRELRPVEQPWNECYEWRFYEGYYNGTHFSIENVELTEVIDEGENGTTRKTRFDGAVLRCKDVCDPNLDIALSGSGTDYQSDLMDPAVFRQFFSARTADGQPADHLVTPQLRELFRKLETLGKKYKVTALRLRNGEAILAVNGYNFGYGLPSGRGSLQDLDGIRNRFKASLTPGRILIDILRDFCGKL